MRNLNLVLHCGGSAATREQLADVSTPDPSGRWHPIPHTTLIETVEEALGKLDMRIVGETYGLAQGSQRMFGILQIANGNNSDEYSYVAGIRNSHDKSFPAGLCVGSGVFVCDNLAFSSEIVFGRRHTTNIMNDLPQLVTLAVGKLASHWGRQAERIDAYKNRELRSGEAFEMLFDAAESKVFPETRWMDIAREYKAPKHPEFKDRNVWSFFNAVTENLKPRKESKGTTLWSLPARTERLHAICDSMCGLSPVKEAAAVPA